MRGDLISLQAQPALQSSTSSASEHCKDGDKKGGKGTEATHHYAEKVSRRNLKS